MHWIHQAAHHAKTILLGVSKVACLVGLFVVCGSTRLTTPFLSTLSLSSIYLFCRSSRAQNYAQTVKQVLWQYMQTLPIIMGNQLVVSIQKDCAKVLKLS